jgi:hypothetical protein
MTASTERCSSRTPFIASRTSKTKNWKTICPSTGAGIDNGQKEKGYVVKTTIKRIWLRGGNSKPVVEAEGRMLLCSFFNEVKGTHNSPNFQVFSNKLEKINKKVENYGRK